MTLYGRPLKRISDLTKYFNVSKELFKRENQQKSKFSTLNFNIVLQNIDIIQFYISLGGFLMILQYHVCVRQT